MVGPAARVRRRRAGGLVVFSLCVSLSINAASSEPSEASPSVASESVSISRDAARQSFEKGVELANAQRFEEAAIEFERAYAFEPHFSVLYNLARAYQAAGHLSRAIDQFKRYLKLGGDRISKERVDALASELSGLEAQTAQLFVAASARGARASIDGEPSAACPAQLRVDPGRHRLMVSAQGFEDSVQDLEFHAGQSLRVDVRQEAALPVVRASVGAGMSQAPLDVGRLTPRTPVQPASRAHDSWPKSSARASTRRSWAYVSAGTAVALGIVAVGLFVDNEHRYSTWKREQGALDEQWRLVASRDPGPIERQAENDTRGDRIQLMDQITVGTAVAGVGLLALSAVLFLDEQETQALAFDSRHARMSWRLAW